MSRNYTVLLSVLLGAALVVGGVALANPSSQPAAASPASDSAGGSTIHVSAAGSAAAQPDEVVVRLSVEAAAKNASTARERVARNVSSVRSALTDLGLSAEQIRTADYDLYRDERIERPVPGEKRIERSVYRVTHRLTVELDDVESAGSVVDTAVANGATSIHDIRFALNASTRQTLRSKALSEAMRNARAKAETLASSENLTVVAVERITTVGGGGYDYRETALAATPAPGGASTDISAGPVSVSASVQVTYNATGI